MIEVDLQHVTVCFHLSVFIVPCGSTFFFFFWTAYSRNKAFFKLHPHLTDFVVFIFS